MTLLTPIELANGDHVLLGDTALSIDFEALWTLHPPDYHRISIMGRERPVPRWSEAYEIDYAYSGRVDRARSMPEILAPVRDWARANTSKRINGLLVNWYDAQHAHYIGKHRDSTTGLIPDEPIVTISFGATRTFRMRPWKNAGFVDIDVTDRSVIVIPWDTNLRWTHEVLHRRADFGRRVSVTLRAFETARRGAATIRS